VFWNAAIRQPPDSLVIVKVWIPCRGSGMPGGIRAPTIVHRTWAIATPGARNRTSTSDTVSVLSRNAKANAADIRSSSWRRPFQCQPATFTTSESSAKSAA
jgi:hypothetical protein